MNFRNRHYRRKSYGFSLLEVVLVLSLLVVLTALVYPSLERPFAAERLRKGADQLRSEWMRSRIRAMTSGVPQVFRYEPESGKFRVEAWAAADSEIEAQTSLAFQDAGSGQTPVLQNANAQHDRQLPENVLFVGSQTLANSKAALVVATQTNGPDDQAAWSEPIYFYPDGTTSTSRLLLKNEHELFVVLDLRGLTGVVTVSDVMTEQEVPQ